MLFPDNFEQKIDFTGIRQLLISLCTFTLGRELIDKISFSSDCNHITKQIEETQEMLEIISDSSLDLPIGNFHDLREQLQRIRVEGLFLDEAEVFSLRHCLEAVRLLVVFTTQLDENRFPHLKALAAEIQPMELIAKQIDKILDKFGKLKDNASPELARIRRDMLNAQGSVSRTLNAILRKAQADGFIDKDVTPTLREGRLVIPVSPMYKRKIGGIVHDESATGKTVFIEPAQVVEANNHIRELEGEERREKTRILLAFTNFIRPYIPEIITSQYFLGKIDFLRAKALFAEQIGGIAPQIKPEPLLDWQEAVHPLLLLSLRRQGKNIVPLTIRLDIKQRILLISGPNAGGKSVCLKTVAMLQYMMQCGLLVPLRETSQMGLFERIFIDIGDEQSIENDLSTYSSHLLNMKFFVRNSQQETLLLIDEFGSGTEPQIGGAIAEATLDRLNQNGSYGVITTHYTNLKHFAEDAEGIVNGAMLYDRHLLRPLFQLEIGRPGSSFAVEIARKIGLPEDIIASAVEKVGTDYVDYDKHLQDIARDKRYWETKRQKIRLKEKQLDEKMAYYEGEMGQLKSMRKEILAQARQEAQDLLFKSNATIENTIRRIKEAQAEKEATQTARRQLKNYVQQIQNQEESKPKQKQTHKEKPAKQQTTVTDQTNSEQPKWEIGASVRLKKQSVVGTILELSGKKAIIAVGELKSAVPLTQLEPVSNNQLKATRSSRKSEITMATISSNDKVRQRKLTFKHDIDVRGMRGDEALQAVTYFIDDAIMVNAGTVRILHGTGNGILRQLIRQYLNTVAGVSSFRDEHVQFGGAGITVVELA